MWQSFASNLFTVSIVGLIGAAGVIGWGQAQFTAEGPLEEAICLQVPRGGSMSGVADDLVEQRAISNATIYRLGADYSGKVPDLKAGSFLIEPGTSMRDIIDQITGDGLSTCGTEVLYLVSVASQRKRVRELNPETQEFEVTGEFDPVADSDLPESYVAALDDVATEFRVIVAEGVTSWQVVEALKASDLFEGDVPEVPAEGA
ncbi:MAG: branched-chain alpha-keto acid dehydrogenase subunit E2, partial [Pseudomonadota bacterium]